MSEQQQSAIDHIDVRLDADGNGSYTAIYANGEKGPHSEGYEPDHRLEGEARIHSARKAAMDAAARDFPELASRPGGIRIVT